MSSTTSRLGRLRAERGQILVLFAGGVTVLLILAALAFDAGLMLLERRDQQNAADAAALAGARFVLTSASDAETAARQLAQANGFDDADPNETVNVFIPPIHGQYARLPGFIEVQIEAARPSVFAGIMGRDTWPVGADAVATNKQNLTFPFSMLALDATACKAIQVNGNGTVEAHGSIQANSNGAACAGDPIGFSRAGGSTVNIIADDDTCRAVGEIQDQGSGLMTCTRSANSFALPDPLRDREAPTKPPLAIAMKPVGHTKAVPRDCPGGSPAPSEGSPQTCKLAPTGAYKDLAWILYPGLYPGGLNVSSGAIAYLMPGIYWIGGGGVSVSTDGSIFTIATETDATPNVVDATWGGGVLIYNSALPGAAGGPMDLNSSSATMRLKALHAASGSPDEAYNGIVIFQDRTLTTTVTLNGSASTAEVEGLIYVPGGLVKLTGNSGTTLIVDQVIAGTFDIEGNGTIKVLRTTGFDAIIVAAGLVE